MLFGFVSAQLAGGFLELGRLTLYRRLSLHGKTTSHSIMPRRYIFADESGDFTFARGYNISKYFIVCTVTMGDCDAAHTLLALRRDMAWRKMPLKDYFHATIDVQPIRDEVFAAIKNHTFKVQATIMEKSKAQPQVKQTASRFYKYGWLYHFRHSIAPYITPDDEVMITTASIGTKKAQGVFTDAVNDVIQQSLSRQKWATYFCSSASDPCLQLTDYCTWAIQRKWERGDSRAFDVIKDRITYEYDLWRHGTMHYY